MTTPIILFPYIILTLNAVSGNTRYQIFLEFDKHKNDRKQRDDRHGKQAAVIVVAVRVGVHVQCQRNGVILRAADKNQRLEEVLSDPVEREDGRRNDSGLNNGHQNFEQDTDFGAAIDHGRFIQLFGDAAHVLHDQKDEERTAECPR